MTTLCHQKMALEAPRQRALLPVLLGCGTSTNLAFLDHFLELCIKEKCLTNTI
jgi:hypothetical protein